MAKRTRAAASGLERLNIGVERAENGAIVRVSGEGKGKNASYTSRTFIAPNGRAAMRIATTHIQGIGKKIKSGKAKATKGRARKS
jgi:hypothetical protein